MRNIYFALVGIFIAILSMDAKVVERLTTVVTTELINGDRFCHKIETDGISSKEYWTINGVMVSQEHYDERALEAEKKERKMERAKEYQRLVAQTTFKQTVRAEITKKLLKNIVEELESLLSKLQQHSLEQYSIFSMATVPHAQAYRELKERIKEAQNALCLDPQDHAQEIADLYSYLEEWPCKVQKFFESTVQEAIRRCDDTRVLKELLALVS